MRLRRRGEHSQHNRIAERPACDEMHAFTR